MLIKYVLFDIEHDNIKTLEKIYFNSLSSIGPSLLQYYFMLCKYLIIILFLNYFIKKI